MKVFVALPRISRRNYERKLRERAIRYKRRFQSVENLRTAKVFFHSCFFFLFQSIESVLQVLHNLILVMAVLIPSMLVFYVSVVKLTGDTDERIVWRQLFYAVGPFLVSRE